jgi:hypothetical protein
MAVQAPPCSRVLAVSLALLLLYSIYSVAIDRHASKTVDAMMKAPSPFDLLKKMNHHDDTHCSSSIPPIDKLRKTISRTSNIVERPQDITLWNQWAACAMSMNQKGQNTFNINDVVPIVGATATYEWVYRSHVNFEEKGAICQGLYSWYIWTSPFIIRGKTILTFSKQQCDDGSDVVRVTMTDRYFGKRFTPISINWHGLVMSSPPLPSQRGLLVRFWSAIARVTGASLSSPSFRLIQWTHTEMIIGRAGSKNKQVIANPPIAEKLRQVPWQVLQETDGMMLLQRGSIGVLAYDRKS